jgi:archaellum component FlaC
MDINKAHWITEGDNVRLSMPIGKVDVERRMVSGFATLDNVDRQGDIVTTEASMLAFKNFRGNIREMHQPLAVGKMVSFKEDRYFDPNTKKFYNGVYVSAYVSKGAQDTWEKILDGTLSGFSIGGNITKSDDSYDDKLDKSIRIIKEYDLHELSLVDNPANQFANVFSIEKVNGENQASGYLSKAEIENVYWDSENDIVLISTSNSENSPHSGKPMKNIGFVEKNDADNAEMIKFLVDSAKGIKTIKMQKEEGPMTEETTPVEVTETPAETVVEDVEVAPEAQPEEVVAPAEEVAAPAEEVVAPVEEVAAPAEESAPSVSVEAEVHAENIDVAKSQAAVVEAVADIKNSLNNAFGDLEATIKSINDKVAELSKSLADVTNSVAAVTKDVADVKGGFNEFGKRVDKVEADTAFRKSGDLGEIVQEFSEMKTQKSLWGGRFLKNTDLFN